MQLEGTIIIAERRFSYDLGISDALGCTRNQHRCSRVERQEYGGSACTYIRARQVCLIDFERIAFDPYSERHVKDAGNLETVACL